MRGCEIMANLSYAQEMQAIADILKKEIAQLQSLPKEEAKKEAKAGLISVGIIDESGNLTPPYVALRNRYV